MIQIQLTQEEKANLFRKISILKCQVYADLICIKLNIPHISIIYKNQKKIKSWHGEYIKPDKIITYAPKSYLEFLIHELAHHFQYHRYKNKIYGYAKEKICFDNSIVIMSDRQHGPNFRQCYKEIMETALIPNNGILAT